MRIRLLVGALVCCVLAAAAKEVVVEGSCEFIMPRHLSETEAVQTAIQQAKTEALAKEFGTLISSELWTETQEEDTDLSEYFYHSGLSLVKGEWIKDIQTPEVSKALSTSGDIIITVKVKGKARAIESLPLDLVCYASLPGANIPQKKFHNGTRFTLHFKSPEDGYIAVYLGDENGDICRLLPFSQQSDASTPVKAMKRYEFFTSQEGDNEQYRFLTHKEREINTLYIIFARKEFPRPIDIYNEDRNLRMLKRGEFLDWLGRLRSSDPTVQLQTIPIVILSSDNKSAN